MSDMKFFLKNLLKKSWLPYAILAAVIFAVYAPSLRFDFTYLDDNVLILNNFNFISNPANLLEAFRQDVFHVLHMGAFFYRPFLTLLLMFDAIFGGQSSGFYHFSFIALHIFSVFLLFILLQKMSYGKTVSFWASLIFAVHPLLTQSVAWIPGGNDLLMTVFVLLSFIFFIDYVRDRKWKSLAPHLIFWLSALLTKETAVFAPVIFISYLLLRKKEILTGIAKKSPNDLFAVLGGWLAAFVIWFFLRLNALNGQVLQIPFFQSLKFVFQNLPAVILYIGRIVLPFNLSVYPILRDSNFTYGIAAILLLTVLLWLNRKNLKPANLLFGAVWFLIFLIPSFLRPNRDMTADFVDSRAYLPAIGFVIIFLEIKWRIIGERLSGLLKISSEKINIALLTALVIFLSVTTVRYSDVFNGRMNFWLNAAENSPHSPLVHRNLGVMYWLDGNADAAEIEYKKTLVLNPDEPMVNNNLGLVYQKKGDNAAAVGAFLEELRINPNFGITLYNLGSAYWALGRKADAAQKWQETIAANPDYLDAYRSLIGFYAGINRPDIVRKLYMEFYSRGGR